MNTRDELEHEAGAAPANELPLDRAFDVLSASQMIKARTAMAHDCLPVMVRTARRLERLREHAATVAANELTEIILDDCLMTVRVLGDAVVNGKPTAKIESVTSAIVMIGVEPFFDHYRELVLAEPLLANKPFALIEYQRLNRVASRAARLAGAFCGAANDPDVPAIYLASLLHAAARIKLCVHEPALAVLLRELPCDAGLAAAVLARHDLSGNLVTLVGGNEERMDPQMRRVQLAVAMARALDSGWSSPELADLLGDLARLFGLSVARARQIVESVRV